MEVQSRAKGLQEFEEQSKEMGEEPVSRAAFEQQRSKGSAGKGKGGKGRGKSQGRGKKDKSKGKVRFAEPVRQVVTYKVNEDGAARKREAREKHPNTWRGSQRQRRGRD